jgi:hypothetical protein
MFVTAALFALVSASCPAPENVLASIGDDCFALLAEEDFRVAAAGNEAQGKHLAELISAQGFPFTFKDPDGKLSGACGEKMQGAFKGVDKACVAAAQAPLMNRIDRAVAALDKSLVAQIAKFRSSEGFGKTKWGMTASDVKGAVPGLKSTTNSLGKEALAKADTVASFPTQVTYTLASDHLFVVQVALATKYTSGARYVADFDRLVTLLSEKYGQPIENDVSWASDAAARLQSDDIPSAVVLGQATLEAKWETENTLITLTCVGGKRFHPQTAVTYVSKELGAWGLAKSNAKQAADL